jgi:cobalamin synthase
MDAQEIREKHDKELIELLNELRIGLNGAQVLFAFLLVAPFSSKWEVTRAEKGAYLIALFSSLLGVALLIAPMAYHRLRWRQWNKEQMLVESNRLAIGGIVAVAVAMASAVYLVVSVLTNTQLTIVLTLTCLAIFGFAWFVLPLTRPYDRWDEHVDELHGSRKTRS